MTTPCLSVPLALHSPWWQRAADDLAAAFTKVFASRRKRAAAQEFALYELDGLSAETLKDIGAPDWLIERANRGRWSGSDADYWRSGAGR